MVRKKEKKVDVKAKNRKKSSLDAFEEADVYWPMVHAGP